MRRFTATAGHLLFWLTFIANSVLTYDSTYLSRYGIASIGVKQATFYAVMSVAVYVNYLLLTPKYLAKRCYGRYASYAVILIGAMLVLFLGHALFLDWYFSSSPFFIDDRLSSLPYVAFQVFFFILISTGARISTDWVRYQRLREEMQREQGKAELALLRHQISPHFLFNALNNIYSLSLHHPARTPQAILTLSQLMRYSVRTISLETAPLKDELAHLKSYTELKKLQTGTRDVVRMSVEGDIEAVRIPPMLLIPFLENAFKHGSLRDIDEHIGIDVSVSENRLLFRVENPVTNARKDPTPGIGLVNVRRRLELLYPSAHTLDISDTGDRFIATLMLQLP